MSVRKIAVCDDVDIEREMLCVMLRDCDEKQMIFQFSSGEDLLNAHENFDLVFLDIYMSGMSGMEAAKLLHEQNHKTKIVFLTSSADFALESYEVNAFDYIVKPLQPHRLQRVWERFNAQSPQKPKYYMLSVGGKTEKIPYRQIEFLSSDCHYVTFHLVNGTEIKVLGKLDDFEQQLNDARFLRCHKSFLINMSLAEKMENDFIMRSGAYVAYRKRDKKQIQKIYSSYLLKRA